MQIQVLLPPDLIRRLWSSETRTGPLIDLFARFRSNVQVNVEWQGVKRAFSRATSPPTLAAKVKSGPFERPKRPWTIIIYNPHHHGVDRLLRPIFCVPEIGEQSLAAVDLTFDLVRILKKVGKIDNVGLKSAKNKKNAGGWRLFHRRINWILIQPRMIMVKVCQEIVKPKSENRVQISIVWLNNVHSAYTASITIAHDSHPYSNDCPLKRLRACSSHSGHRDEFIENDILDAWCWPHSYTKIRLKKREKWRFKVYALKFKSFYLDFRVAHECHSRTTTATTTITRFHSFSALNDLLISFNERKSQKNNRCRVMVACPKYRESRKREKELLPKWS